MGTTICSGKQTTLTANYTGGGPNYSFSWATSAGNVGNTASINVSPSTTTTYTVTITNGCTPSASCTQTITINSTLVSCNDYKPYIVNNNLYILYTNLTNNISQIQVTISGINYNMIINDLNTKDIIYQNAFDVTCINNEQYIYYIDTNQVLHELWNPISINIRINDIITNIQAVINSTNSSLYPSFDTNIVDYELSTGTETSKITYVITINNKITITDMAYPNQSICISDPNNNKYYIKFGTSRY